MKVIAGCNRAPLEVGRGASEPLPVPRAALVPRSAPGVPGSAGDAKAVFAAELTSLISRYMTALGLDTEPAERVMVGVVGLVDATAAWWVLREEPSRAVVAAELTDQVWLLLTARLANSASCWTRTVRCRTSRKRCGNRGR